MLLPLIRTCPTLPQTEAAPTLVAQLPPLANGDRQCTLRSPHKRWAKRALLPPLLLRIAVHLQATLEIKLALLLRGGNLAEPVRRQRRRLRLPCRQPHQVQSTRGRQAMPRRLEVDPHRQPQQHQPQPPRSPRAKVAIAMLAVIATRRKRKARQRCRRLLVRGLRVRCCRLRQCRRLHPFGSSGCRNESRCYPNLSIRLILAGSFTKTNRPPRSTPRSCTRSRPRRQRQALVLRSPRLCTRHRRPGKF